MKNDPLSGSFFLYTTIPTTMCAALRRTGGFRNQGKSGTAKNHGFFRRTCIWTYSPSRYRHHCVWERTHQETREKLENL